MKFVFDLDGTICFDGMTIAEEIKECLITAEQYGHEVIFASARSYRDCIGVLGEKLSQNLVIGLNGGLAYQNGKPIFHRSLEELGYREALSFCRRYDLPYFVDDDFNYCSHRMEQMPFAKHVDPLSLGKKVALSDLKSPIKMVVQLAQHEDLIEDMLYHLSIHDQLDLDYHEHEKCLYINPHQTNKATTLVDLIGNNFVAFGNDKNDRVMFQESLYSCQVGDYQPLKEFADDQVAADSLAVAEKIKDLFKLF